MHRHALLLLLALTTSACGRGYSEGQRAGVVTKFSYKGVLWKSWEGEMNLGGMREETDSKGGTSMSPNVWAFHVDSMDVVDQVKAALDSGATVKMRYVQWWISPMSQESDYDVVEVTSHANAAPR